MRKIGFGQKLKWMLEGASALVAGPRRNPGKYRTAQDFEEAAEQALARRRAELEAKVSGATLIKQEASQKP